MNPSTRRTARWAGIVYFVTHVTSVGAVALYGALLTDPAWVSSSGSSAAQSVGVLLDLVLAVAVVGTGVLLYPLIRRAAPAAAIGYVALRTLEAGVIVLGAAAVTVVIALRGTAAADPTGGAFLELYRAAFLFGPGLVVGVNTTVLAVALFRHRLVARWIPVLGVTGAVIVTASNLAVMFGLQPQVSVTASLAAIPIFVWEISLAIHLIARGVSSRAVAVRGPEVA